MKVSRTAYPDVAEPTYNRWAAYISNELQKARILEQATRVIQFAECVDILNQLRKKWR